MPTTKPVKKTKQVTELESLITKITASQKIDSMIIVDCRWLAASLASLENGKLNSSLFKLLDYIGGVKSRASFTNIFHG